MQQIADWLEKLGVPEYAQRFAENKIDVSVLRHLTDDDLKDLGVPLGHRRKILAAVNQAAGSIQPLAEATGIGPKTQEAPERRQITVLFSDLVGSTALSARMDPEDLRDVISAYQTCVAEAVGRFDGFVAKYMGDGVLAFFGYPEAHEDDPERAVRAGLELVTAVGSLKTHAPLQTRVGIATGLVVVGDLIGSGSAQEQAVVGKTPNLAARLQGVAASDMVVIAESTRKLLGNLFEVEELGAKDLKGIAGPVRAWAVLRPSSAEGRFEALHASGLTDLVGRQEELDLLLRRWSKATAGEGQVVLLSGEAGIGKSRLTAALSERLATEPHTRLRYFCSPQHTDSALYPIISHIERAAGFAHGDAAQAKLDKLDAVLAQSYTPPQDRALFAELLSLPNDGRYPTLELTSQQRRQQTLTALTTQSMALAEQSPVLMIFEDIHWIDPTSLEALGRGIDRIKAVGVLLIITHRPEFEPPWIGRPYVTTLTINRLGQREIAAIIDAIAGNNPLPRSITEDIIERTDSIEPDGTETVYGLQTTTGNYVVWGLASSNSAQYQQMPSPRGGGIIQRLWWQLWDQDVAHRYGLEWHGARKEFPPCELICASLDTSYGEKQENDFNALTVWGVWIDRMGNRRGMLMYAWAKKLPLHGKVVTAYPDESKLDFEARKKKEWGLVEWVADTCRRYKVTRMLIEDKTRGRDVAQEINRLYAREKWGVELIPVARDKTSRAHSTVSMFTDNGVWAPQTKWSDAVIKECADFPKAAALDAASLMLVLSAVSLAPLGAITFVSFHAR